ncbi:uncharacterized protein TNCV_2617381 [Trichonephila clavipes]|nr:uncharacterized protein TNCV_2617381 [Trichonephila clavipes]
MADIDCLHRENPPTWDRLNPQPWVQKASNKQTTPFRQQALAKILSFNVKPTAWPPLSTLLLDSRNLMANINKMSDHPELKQLALKVIDEIHWMQSRSILMAVEPGLSLLNTHGTFKDTLDPPYHSRVPDLIVAAVAEWYRYRTVACFVTGSSPVPLKTRRVGQRCTLNLSRAETSSRWCGVVVRRGGCQLRCRPRHLTMVQNYVVRRQKPSCS